MFVRPLALYAVALACITQVQAAISILEPNSQTTWYKNNTVQMTWGSSAGDPNPFRILLNNSEGVMSTNATLADSVNTDLKGLTILLPQLLDSNGYTIYFVNTSNSTQVYAASQPFIIASGQVPSTAASASGAAASTLTATSANIPGPYTPFSATAVRTATQSGSASPSSATTNDAGASHSHQVAALLAAGVGAIAVGVLL